MLQGPAKSAPRAELRALLLAPRAAVPTVLLLMLTLSLWLAVLGLALEGLLPWPLAFGLNWALAYASFTPMHDAAHRSILRSRVGAEFLGRLASIPLTAPFAAFRFVHLQHHRYTNEAERDPDLWSGQGPRFALPLRWLSQDGHYYFCWLRAWSRHSLREKLELGGDVLLLLSLIVLASARYGFDSVLILWLVPARLAIGALAWSFDYLPHRPHRIHGRVDRYRATHALRGAWLSIPLLCQNLHIIHHLYPGVPFYRYPAIWRLEREALLAAGVRELGIFEAGPTEEKDSEASPEKDSEASPEKDSEASPEKDSEASPQ